MKDVGYFTALSSHSITGKLAPLNNRRVDMRYSVAVILHNVINSQIVKKHDQASHMCSQMMTVNSDQFVLVVPSWNHILSFDWQFLIPYFFTPCNLKGDF